MCYTSPFSTGRSNQALFLQGSLSACHFSSPQKISILATFCFRNPPPETRHDIGKNSPPASQRGHTTNKLGRSVRPVRISPRGRRRFPILKVRDTAAIPLDCFPHSLCAYGFPCVLRSCVKCSKNICNELERSIDTFPKKNSSITFYLFDTLHHNSNRQQP